MNDTISNRQNKDNNKEENISLSYTIGIPAVLVDDKNLSDRQFRLMIHLIGLARKEGYCYASDKYLAAKMGVTISQIQRELLSLEKMEYITRNTVKNGMISDRSIYVAPAFSKKPYEYAHVSTSGTHTCVSRVRTGEHPNILSRTKSIKKKKRERERECEREKAVAVAPPPPLISFGEFKKIQLSQEDFDALTKKFGKERLEQMIIEVDEWLASSGQTKKNHKAFLQSWPRKNFKTAINKEDLQEKHKAYAKQTLKDLRKTRILTDVKFEIYDSYLEIGLKSHPNPKIIKFSEKGFKERVESELRKMGLK